MINVSRMGVGATYLNLRSRENVEERFLARAGLESNYTDGGGRISPLRKLGNNPFIGIMKDYPVFSLILKDNQCKVFHGQWP